MASASSAVLPGSKPNALTPSSKSSAAPPARATITGRAQAIASTMVRPKGSGWVLACTTTFSAR